MAFKYQYIIDSAPGATTSINGKRYLYFAGTGYFQLNDHPDMLKAASEATLKYGIGSSTSRVLTGTTPLLIEIEKRIAEFFNTEDAAYLPSGYLSNIAGMKALSVMNRYDVIFIDEGSHYSLSEAALTSGKPIVKFKNLDTDDLAIKIKKNLTGEQKPLIVTDGLFPIWARTPRLDRYFGLAEEYDGIVWIDDAHGVGILGKNGRGTYEHLDISSPRLYMGATLSKAFGAYGGIIPGDAEFISAVKTGSVMTGASPPMNASVAAGLQGIKIVKENPEMRDKLWDNARYLKNRIKETGINADDNCLPIVAFEHGSEAKMKRIHTSLMDEGIYIQFTKYKGAGSNGVLRIVVFSTHTKDQINYLTDKLAKLL